MKPTITVIGTGRMGSALVLALRKQEYRVVIWNRTKAKGEPLAAQGAQLAATVLDAVTAADVILVNVNDYATSNELLQTDGVTSALRGKLLIQLTSGTPKQARTLGDWAHRAAIPYLVGAIMATPNLIGEPGCTILYAGAVEQYEQSKAVLLALGGNPVYLGDDVGHASTLDNALLALVWGAMFATLQGATICTAEQFPLAAYGESIRAILPAVEESTIDIVRRIEQQRFAGETSLGTVDLHSGGVLRLLQLCQEHGIDPAVPNAFVHLFQLGIKAGHGPDDFAVLSKFITSYAK